MTSNSNSIQLKIVGIFTSSYYQRAKCYADYLHNNIPDEYKLPQYRPMLDVQWTEFLTKMRRTLGGRMWFLQTPVAIFKNNEFFGNDTDIVKFCDNKYGIQFYDNFTVLGHKTIQQFVQNTARYHVYFTITINDINIGTLLIQLYNDLVPVTCENFLRLVRASKRGYKNSPIHRIAKTGWIQIGGYHLKRNDEILACENYYVHHERRGVLSMCNRKKHRKNDTQFFISLQPTAWMDYRYVAFGQVLHGEEVLKRIENVETHYESPTVKVLVDDCGDYTFIPKPDKDFLKDHKVYVNNRREYSRKKKQQGQLTSIDSKDSNEISNYPDDISDFRDVDSFLSEDRYIAGLYSLEPTRKYSLEDYYDLSKIVNYDFFAG